MNALVGMIFAFCGLCPSQNTKPVPLEVGMAEVEITPPVGYPMAGYYHERLATGKKDPLKVKSLVFRQGGTTGAIIACDLTGVSGDLSDLVRESVSKKTGIPFSHIALTGSHSHTAPDYSRDLYSLVTKTPYPTGKPRHAENMVGLIVSSVTKAKNKLTPVTVKSGSANQKEQVSFHRRFVMRDGSVRTWTNLKNPEVIKAAGPIDSELGLVQFSDSAAQKPIGIVSNFALHLDTVGGLEWSADFPYYLEKANHEFFGTECISLFGLGCCGNINHVNPFGEPVNKTPHIGRSLAENMVKALPTLSPVSKPDFQIAHKRVELPLRTLNEGEADRALKVLDLVDAKGKVDFLDHVAAYKILIMNQFQKPEDTSSSRLGWGRSRKFAGVGSKLPVEVQVFSLGNQLAIVCLPGEVFVEHGLAIKAGSPFKTTMIFELTNVVETAYIPTRGAYSQGGYEVVNSITQPGSGEMLVEATLELLRNLATKVPNTP